ncbi:hypothetical protein, partial [Streptobacillus felis]|uniref:hypothetical protein n=1 Tax=Streptobacillus felis TaxID=1384509 RepID=UPI000A91950C
ESDIKTLNTYSHTVIIYIGLTNIISVIKTTSNSTVVLALNIILLFSKLYKDVIYISSKFIPTTLKIFFTTLPLLLSTIF